MMVNIRPNDPNLAATIAHKRRTKGAVNVWFEKKIVFKHRNLIDGALENRSDAILSLCYFDNVSFDTDYRPGRISNINPHS